MSKYYEPYCRFTLRRFITSTRQRTNLYLSALIIKCTFLIILLITTDGSQVQISTKISTQTLSKYKTIKPKVEKLDNSNSRTFDDEAKFQKIEANRYNIFRRGQELKANVYYDDDDNNDDRHNKEPNEENKENPPSPPEFSLLPSRNPSSPPTLEPTLVPSSKPSKKPSTPPSSSPSESPSLIPSTSPSILPSSEPNNQRI